MPNKVQFEIARLSNLIKAYKDRHDTDTAEYHARHLFDYITANRVKEKAAIILRINTFFHNAITICMATSIITMIMAITDIRPLPNTIAFFASTMMAGTFLAATVLTLNHLAAYLRHTYEQYDDKARAFIEKTI